MRKYSPECPVCESKSIIQFNSYKHKCNACTDCNSVHHVKKSGRSINFKLNLKLYVFYSIS